MNRDDVIRMAQAAGFCLDVNNGIYLCAPQHIERLIAIAAAAEREACAKASENAFDGMCFTASDARTVVAAQRKIAAAIRARGEK